MNKLITFLQSIAEKQGWALVMHSAWVVVIGWVPMQVIWFTFHFVCPGPTEEDFLKTPLEAITLAVFLAPVLETQIMRMIFFAGGKFMRNNLLLCSVSAVIWGLLHVASESWGVHAVWAFFVMGICFRELQKDSGRKAVRVVTVIHAGCNALSYGCYLVFNP